MIVDLKNPFDLVKATDLSDSQIADYFVDFPEGASLLNRVKPTSPMPMFIFGGKGSGKTHLMRYLAYPLQVRRHGQGLYARAGIKEEGYLGIYFRCGGLNAQRFIGKGQEQDVWEDVFAYYMELWLAQLLLTIITDLYEDMPSMLSPQLIDDMTRLLDISPSTTPTSLKELTLHLETLQRQADVAINNCALTRTLDIHIQATRGRLTFGIPQVLSKHLHDLGSVLFLYLVDEFENLTEPQQRYFNTLVRERPEPTSLKVGVRLYGLRTKQTLSAEEENREDSEYEALRLDAELRDRPNSAQFKFAEDLVRKRLTQSGYFTGLAARQLDLTRCFDPGENDFLLRTDESGLRERYRHREPQYIKSLQQKLQQGLQGGLTPGLRVKVDIQRLLAILRYPDDPIIERTSIFLLYRAWAHGKPLIEAAEEIAESARQYGDASKATLHHDVLRYFRSDITAQLLRETKQKQRYLGFDTFITMSAGLPRCLLTLLKHIFTWSTFYGEQPFQGGQISVRAQSDGVAQASEWFFTEARAPGLMGALVRDAMTRLGQLLRDVRFSDKPSECSLSSFSADLTTASERAIAVLKESENWSMLIRVSGGQHDRNEGRVDDKYQVHPMLAPRWDLPIARRGALGLSGEEVTAIFSPSSPSDFEIVRRRRVGAMTAPFFGQNRGNEGLLLPGFIDG